jgi:hypothetical protein
MPFRAFVVPETRDVTGIPVTVIGTELKPETNKLEKGAALGMFTSLEIPTITCRFPAVTLPAGMRKETVPGTRPAVVPGMSWRK